MHACPRVDMAGVPHQLLCMCVHIMVYAHCFGAMSLLPDTPPRHEFRRNATQTICDWLLKDRRWRACARISTRSESYGGVR